MTEIGTRRKSKPLSVPDLEDDPAERKRVLNVLAQRRYRRRKKDHFQRLEKSVTSELLQPPIPQDAQYGSTTEREATPAIIPFDQFSNEPYLNCLDEDAGFIPDIMSMQQAFGQSGCFDPGSLDAFDASLNIPLPSLPTSPSLTTQTMTPRGATTVDSGSLSPSAWLDQSLGFPDEIHLPILELNLLRGAMEIAKRLQIDSIIWSLEANSPFHNSKALTFTHLPINLRPSNMQLRNAHHPALDILPWPSVRDKLILVFSQPEDFRPPSARSPTALLDFIYDLEDSSEGVRIWGDDPYSDENWEVGEKLFKNWWWAFDRQILNRSNGLRRNRGAKLLGMDRSRDVQEIE